MARERRRLAPLSFETISDSAALFVCGDTMDSLIYFGEAIKTLDDNGKVGGYLVRFSDNGVQKDLTGEYFTTKTYLGARDCDGVDTIFHHGQPLPIKAKLTAVAASEMNALSEHIFEPIKTKRDTVGIWAETVLKMADDYEKAVYGLVKAGKLGWSSGAVDHLVKKSSGGEITRWPIGEASMTLTPAEPLNRTVTIKALESVEFLELSEDDDDALKAVWTTAYINTLPDSAFLVIEGGGEKDSDGTGTNKAVLAGFFDGKWQLRPETTWWFEEHP